MFVRFLPISSLYVCVFKCVELVHLMLETRITVVCNRPTISMKLLRYECSYLNSCLMQFSVMEMKQILLHTSAHTQTHTRVHLTLFTKYTSHQGSMQWVGDRSDVEAFPAIAIITSNQHMKLHFLDCFLTDFLISKALLTCYTYTLIKRLASRVHNHIVKSETIWS